MDLAGTLAQNAHLWLTAQPREEGEVVQYLQCLQEEWCKIPDTPLQGMVPDVRRRHHLHTAPSSAGARAAAPDGAHSRGRP